ncbi:MAG TPA: diguanylate cyclase, partial [Pseudomonadales bacterium]|nr:diguanylate cyclase [Pseudomonadales bacterium]
MSRDTLHLLLLTHSQNEAENIISLLRNSGKATRAHFVESIEDFTEQLQDKSWDLLLAYPQVDDIRSADLFNQIKRLNKDLPVILINDEVNAALMEQS